MLLYRSLVENGTVTEKMRVECNITLHQLSGAVNFRLDEVLTDSLTQRLGASIPLSRITSSGNNQHINFAAKTNINHVRT